MACGDGACPAAPRVRNSGVWGFDGFPEKWSNGSEIVTLLCSFTPSQQQQQQEEEEVLVPHQEELPNGVQPMEGSIGPSRLANASCHCVLWLASY